jgi:ABC-2 type transport system permease protein
MLAVINVLRLAWLVLGLGVALLGLVPRLTAPLAYGLVLAAYLLDFVGGVLELPESVLDAIPFRQLAVPAESLAAGPLVAMLAIGAALAAVGVVAVRPRDLQEA